MYLFLSLLMFYYRQLSDLQMLTSKYLFHLQRHRHQRRCIPPETAVVWVTELAAVVVRTGTTSEEVVNDTSFPYAVPALFVA